MKKYISFLLLSYFKSLTYIFFIMFSLSIIINLLSELDFFKNIQVNSFFPLYLSFLNSPSLIFEMMPFIILISTLFFFINLSDKNEIEVFKYSGFKNSKILLIISTFTFIIGLIFVLLFYNFSSKLKNYYIELKSKYSSDGKYLFVITKNGLWIKDIVDEKKLLINSSGIAEDSLKNSFITEFDSNYNVIRNISSDSINIKNNEWIINKPTIYENNLVNKYEKITLKTNFNYNRIQNLFSNLTSLNLLDLFELRKNYQLISYSTTDIDIQIHKLISYPFYLMMMTIFSSIFFLNFKNIKSTTSIIALGLFFSVIIYYMNNFFNVLGNTEKIPYILSVWLPLAILILVNSMIGYTIDEK